MDCSDCSATTGSRTRILLLLLLVIHERSNLKINEQEAEGKGTSSGDTPPIFPGSEPQGAS
jgi:hypothetical protein